jgi:DNA-binding Lrp family transcriptional regulator
MNQTVQIDETDSKIIYSLLDDARTPLKSIAKKCGISSVSVFNRIKRLKILGVISGGAALFPNIAQLKLPIVATIGINVKENFDVTPFMRKNKNLVQISPCIGKYDFIAFIHAENFGELDKTVFLIKRLGVQKVDVNVWISPPLMVFENIDLQLKGEGAQDG